VENREQLESLQKLGCQTLQGYFISRPVPAEDILALLDRDWLQEFDSTQHVQPKPTII
jgi:EAL domain-containing protein (putative c-di-GMP-specific phosphodiesterase class I)